MKLKAKTLLGNVYTLDAIDGSSTIDGLKEELSKQLYVKKDQQTIVYKGKILKNYATVNDYSIEDGDFFVVIPARKTREVISESKIESPPATPTLNTFTPSKPLKSNGVSKTLHPKKQEIEEDIDITKEKVKSPSDVRSDNVVNGTNKEKPKASLDTSVLAESVSQLTSQLHHIVGNLENISSSISSGSLPGVSQSDLAGLSHEELLTRLPSMDELGLDQLTSMGFNIEAARKAMYLNRMNTQLSMEWLLEHGDEPDASEPLTDAAMRNIISSNSSFVPDAVCVQRLSDMGFSGNDITTALRITANNYEAAAAWLLGDREVVQDEEEDDAIDENNPLLQSLMSNNTIQSALSNPRAMQALRRILEDPSSISDYVNDAEIGPIILQVHNIINPLARDGEDENEDESVDAEDDEDKMDDDEEADEMDEDEEDDE